MEYNGTYTGPGLSIGDTVKWSTSKKVLGTVVHKFTYRESNWVVIEKDSGILQVVRIYEKLELVSKQVSKG